LIQQHNREQESPEVKSRRLSEEALRQQHNRANESTEEHQERLLNEQKRKRKNKSFVNADELRIHNMQDFETNPDHAQRKFWNSGTTYAEADVGKEYLILFLKKLK